MHVLPVRRQDFIHQITPEAESATDAAFVARVGVEGPKIGVLAAGAVDRLAAVTLEDIDSVIAMFRKNLEDMEALAAEVRQEFADRGKAIVEQVQAYSVKASEACTALRAMKERAGV